MYISDFIDGCHNSMFISEFCLEYSNDLQQLVMIGRGYLDLEYESPHKCVLNITDPYDIFEHMYTEDFIGLDIDQSVTEFINQMVEVDMNYVVEFVKRSRECVLAYIP